jgi:omega-amidase
VRITLVQTALHWEQPVANRAHFDTLLAPLAGHTDLVVLPEMFNTGFSMRPEVVAEPMSGPTVAWLRQQAARLGAVVVGSMACAANGQFFNRLLWVRPDGQVQTYDKRHLFGLAGEDAHYTAGAESLTVDWLGWRIRPLICYDLRFPVWSRHRPDAPYDLLLYVANWPARRAHHWRTLLAARAIENQCYTVGVNIVGTDGHQLEYLGDSLLADFQGQSVAHLAHQPAVVTLRLDLEKLQTYREQLPFLHDSDAFEWKN